VELEGRRALVVGLARSGVAAARLLARRGARVTANDRKPLAELPPEVIGLAQEGIELELGGHPDAAFAAAELAVVSPGVPWELPPLAALRARGVPVLGELELAFQLCRGPVAAITGTKGKSTTTAALGAMLRAAGPPLFSDVRVGGNIGEAFAGLVEGADETTTFVIEASSFQLEATERFRPRIAVFLNLSPDHLDRHPSLEAYAQAKARIFANQTEDDLAVVNADDPQVMALAARGRARLVRFSAGARPPGDAAWFEAGAARLARGDREEALSPRADGRLTGRHRALDLLAAAAAARLLGAPVEAIARAVAGFAGVEHVLERVLEIDGIAFFTDSKATNVAAARMSLEALPGRVVAIMGGRYKGGDFGELREVARDKLRAVAAIGEARGRLAGALAAVVPVIACPSLQEAVAHALQAARPGDSVVLAPACSSFDMFADYAARGRAFKAEVQRLAERRAIG
jgi:UDP-N-acetylmuramoylalanine--D-glutamate ligase